ncbi:MAG: hypothetical protein ACI37O_07705 [Candidatus Avelusimicrobium sp.]|uniref:hypothetical protein n=1 Tax=Candidatus Avelusimicrobium sp. TaxID=3048833 RepID=UPI003F006351
MTKTTQATIFRKRQILPARGLNKALQEYGSVDGVVPFKADGTQDTSMTAPLGTKAAPFGNAHFKGFNLYPQLEVQQMVENGVLGSADRFVFWNLDTNNLSAWNGTEIIHLGGNGGGSMDYIFGNGSDGDVTMVSNGVYDTVKNFTNFTLNAGVTLSVTLPLTPLIIRCTGVCTINGIINVAGKGFAALKGHSVGVSPYLIDTEDGNANESQTYAKFMTFDFTPIFGSGGGQGYSWQDGDNYKYATYPAGKGFNGGGAGKTGSAGMGGGGNGGGCVIIVAKKIIVSGSILATGNQGGGGSGYSSKSKFGGGGGGAGGCVSLFANEYNITGTINVNGGTGGTGNYANTGNTGGAGAVIKIQI